jgi:hypothetical protein
MITEEELKKYLKKAGNKGLNDGSKFKQIIKEIVL